MYFVSLVRRLLARSGHMSFPIGSFGGQFSNSFDSGITKLAGCFRAGCLLLHFVLELVQFTKSFCMGGFTYQIIIIILFSN